MATIKAPFNFVPLADKVYTPDWADQISQDIPFSDGVSGYIDLTITAKSPIFIRNGHTKEEAEQGREAIKEAFEANKENPDFTQAKQLPYNSFSKSPDGEYYIPATSIKGEVRSLLEILTFSRMRVDRSIKFAQREWDDAYLYPKQEIQKELVCGYLKWNEGKKRYEITLCGKPYRISHKEIDKYLGVKIFEDNFSKTSNVNLDEPEIIDELQGKKIDRKTASYKYYLIAMNGLSGKINRELSFEKDDSSTKYSTRLTVSALSDYADYKGTIVLTGQPDQWVYPRPKTSEEVKERGSGKFYEFVFPKPSEQNKRNPIPMNEIDFNYFKFIYADSADWPRVQGLLRDASNGVPVFFRKEEKRKGGDIIVEIKDFGLAYMYKLPYENSPNDILVEKYKPYEGKMDMAESIFGRIGTKEDSNAFKGRVHFSNCRAVSSKESEPVTLVLNSPKASYYPIYIKQEGSGGVISLNGNYRTYNDGELSGWKIYVVRNEMWSKKVNDPKLDTTLFPLGAGSIFEGKVSFHNLRPVELGALLSALTFHSTSGCYHLLGQGKPYGLGKTVYEVCLHCNERNEDKDYFMALFERTITNGIGSWRDTPTIKSLFTLSGKEVDSSDYKYMILSMDPYVNEFQEAKTIDKNKSNDCREYLQDFISLHRGVNIFPNSLREQNILIESKASAVLKEVKANYEQSIVNYQAKFDEGNYGEALMILQNALSEVSHPAEPIDYSEVLSYIEDIQSRQALANEKLSEMDFISCERIYQDAMANSTEKTVGIIDAAIAELSQKKISEAERWIDNLQQRKNDLQKGTSDISVFLSDVKVQSIPAFANRLSKRLTPISEADIPAIIEKLSEGIAQLPRKDQKNWFDRGKWKPIDEILKNKVFTDKIFEGVRK